MGGAAFTSASAAGGALHVPRLPTAVQTIMTAQCIELLQPFFDRVRSPYEPPEKKDHGDVDILVGEPKQNIETFRDDKGVKIPNDVRAEIARVFNAERWTKDAPHSSNFAVPLPDSFATEYPDLFTEGEKPYVQVDVHLTAPDLFDWVFFKQSYGDFWQLLGLIVRPYGLTPNETALYFRVKEVETIENNRKAGMLFLTKDVEETLRFLGLDPAVFDATFDTISELFEFVATCRFFKKKAMLDRLDFENANDRQRYKKRPMFRHFLDEWLPHWTGNDGEAADWSKQQVLESAIEAFGGRVSEAHSSMVAEARAHAAEERFFAHIEERLSRDELVGPRDDSLKEGLVVTDKNVREKRNLVIRGLRRWVDFDEITRDPYIRQSPEMDGARQPHWQADSEASIQALTQWVMENWKAVRDLERERQKAAAAKGKAGRSMQQ